METLIRNIQTAENTLSLQGSSMTAREWRVIQHDIADDLSELLGTRVMTGNGLYVALGVVADCALDLILQVSLPITDQFLNILEEN